MPIEKGGIDTAISELEDVKQIDSMFSQEIKLIEGDPQEALSFLEGVLGKDMVAIFETAYATGLDASTRKILQDVKINLKSPAEQFNAPQGLGLSPQKHLLGG